MLKKKYLEPSLWLTAVLLAAPACSLPSKARSGAGNTSGGSEMCPVDTGSGSGGTTGGSGSGGAGGMSMMGSGGSGMATLKDEPGPDNVVTPVACDASTPKVDFPYLQPYVPDPAVLSQVDQVMLNISVPDMVAQMMGRRITPLRLPIGDIQRSEDTANIRGFHWRDASRGVNLGEDFSGSYATAAVVEGSSVGYSTAFPVSMARGAAFDLDLEYAIGEAIGDEMQAVKETVMLAPCMNVLRHPLWGRAQETYGEDPYQVGRLATALAIGVQVHVAADAKHFMAYDVEDHRAENDALLDEQTLREMYGRHFRMVVQDAGVATVMASYNKINHVKATQNKHLLTEVLRDDFGFRGFILSDWWAMPNVDPAGVDAQTLRRTAVEAVKAGLDVELPWGINYGQLESLVSAGGGGELTEADLKVAVRHVLEQKFRFKSDSLTGAIGLSKPMTRYRSSRIICDSKHLDLAEEAAVKSMVLLKNSNNTLPINPSVKKVAVLGAEVPYKVTDGATQNQNNTRIAKFAEEVITGDLGSSRVFPDPMKSVGPFDGIKNTAPSGVEVIKGNTAADAADADFVVVMAGLTPQDEGEEYTGARDRASLELDAKQTDSKYQNIQNNLISSVAAMGKPMVVVLIGGSVISMPWLNDVPAVVMAWYPGQRGGMALGKLLWGNYMGTAYNFSGKLPFTWGAHLDDYALFNGPNGITKFDYLMGYRYFDKSGVTPQFPYGHGLSYTKFEYKKLQLGCSEMSKGATMPVVVNVANTGNVAGDEIVFVFVSFPGTAGRRPMKELKGFTRVSLAPGEEKQVTIPVRLKDLDYFKTDEPTDTAQTGKWVVESGMINVMVGGSSGDLPLMGSVKVNGYETASSAAQ